MNRIIRQVFGTTKPKDIYLDLLTFDKMVTRPIVHVVYWTGLGLLTIAAFGVLGVAAGNAIKDPTAMGILLSFPLLIVGWLAIFIAVLMWRSFCEFYLAIMSIAEDLRHLRQSQDRRDGISPVVAAARTEAAAPPVAEVASTAHTPAADTADKADSEDVLEHPFFNPRYTRTTE